MSKYTEDYFKYYPKKTKSFVGDTLDSLENDEEYIAVADRFLSSIGQNNTQVDDVYEYLRDEEWNLGTSAKRALLDVPSFSDQQKEDYAYLRRRFDNADMGGFNQYLNFAADASIDLITDPISLAAIIAAPFTGGASATGLFANKGLAQAAKLGLKKVGKSFEEVTDIKEIAESEKLLKRLDTGEIDWKKTEQLTKDKRQAAVNQYYKDKVKNLGILGAAEGAIWSGADEYFRQERESENGVNIRDGLNLYDIGTSTLIGSVLGGVIGSGFSKTSTKFSKDAQINLNKFSDEAFVEDQNLAFKASKLKDSVISKTVGKPVTRFLTMSQSSKIMRGLLATFRYDTYKFDERLGSAKLGTGYHETLNDFNGSYNYKYENIIKPFMNGNKMNKDDEVILSKLMRQQNTARESVQEIEGATNKHYEAAYRIRKLANEVLADGETVGIYRRPLRRGVNSWFPRRWLWNEVQSNRDELADIMVKSDAISLDDTAMLALLPEGTDRVEYMRLMNLSNAYEELLTDLPSKNKDDLTDFVDAINRKFNVTMSVDGINFENPKSTYTLGKLFQDVASQKKEIEKRLPDTSRLRDQKYAVANKIIDDMLSKKNEVNTLDIETLGTVMPSSFSPRKLFMLDDFEIEKFISNDFDTLMRDYFTQSSRLYARKKTLGANLEEFNERYIKPISEELSDKGITLTNSDKEELAKLYNFTTGLDDSAFGMNGLNTISDTVKVSQQLAHLPLATLSSLTEVFIPLTRTNFSTWARGLGQTIKNSVQKTSDLTLRELQDRHGLSKEEALSEMHRVFLGLNQAVASRIDGLAGEGVQGVRARKVQDKFFKLNFLDQWTRTVQLASFTMGKDLITRNLKEIIRLESASKVDTKKVKRLSQELLDLGVDIDSGKQWVNNGARMYSSLTDSVTGLRKWDNFYENQVMKGAARFTNEVILDPSKASSIRPHVQQTPLGTILFQFLGYPTAFTNTVLKNFYGQAVRDPIRGGAKILSTGIAMTTVAAGTNWIRNGGNFEDYKGDEQEIDEIMKEAVQRWGGFGYAEYVDRARENAEIGGGFLGSSVKAVTGPIVGDAIDALIYRKGPGELVATNVPGYTLYRSFPSVSENLSFKKDIQDVGQDVDRFLGFRPEKKDKSLEAMLNAPIYQLRKPFRDFNFEGGRLEEKVPRAGDNPSDRVDRLTGMPYSEQSGDLLINRERYALGRLVSLPAFKSASKKLRNYFSNEAEYEDISPIGAEEKKNRIETFIEESKIKEPVYLNSASNGMLYAQTRPDSLGFNKEGRIRSLNPFIYSGKMPEVSSFSSLLDKEDFLNQVEKTDTNLVKELKNINKERDRLSRSIGESLGFIPSEQQEAIIGLHPILVEKEIIEAFKKAGYDSIQYVSDPKPVDLLDLNVNEPIVRSVRFDEKAPVRTAGQRVGATATALLEEIDEVMPGARETLSEAQGFTVDVLPEEKMQPDFVETRELDLSRQDIPEGALKPNTNWLLLDDTMFLETSNMPVLTQETYEKINSQFSPDEKSLVLNDLKLKFGLADSDFKNEIAKGPYHLVTTLLPGIESYRPGKILTIKAATPDSLEKLKTEININDSGQASFLGDIENQLADASKNLEKDEIPPQLYFITEIIQGQDAKYLNDEPQKLLTASEMAAFIKGRQREKPFEFLHHPLNNNVRDSYAQVFASLEPSLQDVQKAQQDVSVYLDRQGRFVESVNPKVINEKDLENAASDYLRLVKITEERPYKFGARFETLDETRKSQAMYRGDRPLDDPETGIVGFRESSEMEDYDPRTDRVFKAKQNGRLVEVMSTPEGDFLVTRDNENAPYEFVLKNPMAPPDAQNRIEYVRQQGSRKKSKQKRNRSASRAKFKPATPAITQEIPILERKTELTENVKNLPAYKAADEETKQRINSLLRRFDPANR